MKLSKQLKLQKNKHSQMYVQCLLGELAKYACAIDWIVQLEQNDEGGLHVYYGKKNTQTLHVNNNTL